MELILEFLFDLILEGSVELSTSHKVPMPVRILAVIVLVACYGILIGVIAMIAIENYKEGNMTAFWVISVIGVGLIVLLSFFARKKYKEIKERK